MRKTTTTVLASLLLIGLLAACNPTTPPTPVIQTPGTTLIEGDSVTFQAVYGGGNLADYQVNATIGATAATCPTAYFPGCVPAVTNTPLRIGEGEVDRLVWADGLNDANPATSGWTQADADIWTAIFDKLPAESCLVMVVPALSSWAAPAHREQIDLLRQWALAYERPNTVKIDWAQFVEDPAIMDKDGVHTRWLDKPGVDETAQAMLYAADVIQTSPTPDPYASSVRADFYRSGVEQCA